MLAAVAGLLLLLAGLLLAATALLLARARVAALLLLAGLLVRILLVGILAHHDAPKEVDPCPVVSTPHAAESFPAELRSAVAAMWDFAPGRPQSDRVA
jgi:hypothetical protein